MDCSFGVDRAAPKVHGVLHQAKQVDVRGAWLGVGRGERHIGVAPAERSGGVDAVRGVWPGRCAG